MRVGGSGWGCSTRRARAGIGSASIGSASIGSASIGRASVRFAI